jgi:serine/threonine protein phosphatase PrpC
VKPVLILGCSINQRRDGVVGFDAFGSCLDQGLFALCDGANSCPGSGMAAQWLCQKLVTEAVSVQDQAAMTTLFYRLHSEMHQTHPETAATALLLRAKSDGLGLSSLGDSSMRAYRRSLAGWGGWTEECEMPRDIDAQGHPTQLMGSEVLNVIHHEHLPARGPLLVLMMSDGPANVLSKTDLYRTMKHLGRRRPSSADLDYLSAELTARALDLGCRDDVSVALIWVEWP